MDADFTAFVVDDDNAVRDSLSALLRSAGFAVAIFCSGEDFLEDFEPERRGCILIDVRMPGIDGLELLQELRSMRANLPVVLITGHGDVAMAVKAMQGGAVDFIEKPFADDRILQSVRRARDLAMAEERDERPNDEMAQRFARLTPREHEVLKKLIIGSQNKVIAAELGISPRTVEIHRARVMEKMHADSLSHLVRMAISAGIEFE